MLAFAKHKPHKRFRNEARTRYHGVSAISTCNDKQGRRSREDNDTDPYQYVHAGFSLSRNSSPVKRS